MEIITNIKQSVASFFRIGGINTYPKVLGKVRGILKTAKRHGFPEKHQRNH